MLTSNHMCVRCPSGVAHAHENKVTTELTARLAGDASQEAVHSAPEFTVAFGNAQLSVCKRALYILFYMWMSTQNLVCSSVLWARCAEVVPASDARRVFGILAAAATAGQLAGASAMGFVCRRCGASLPVGVRLPPGYAYLCWPNQLSTIPTPVRATHVRLDGQACIEHGKGMHFCRGSDDVPGECRSLQWVH